TAPALDGDDRVGAVTYALTGADAGLFVIDADTGIVTSLAVFDFDTPTDDGADNIYSLTITASDSATTVQTATADFTVSITDVSFSITATDSTIAENAIFASTAPDFTGDDRVGVVTYALTGADADLFVIDPTTGVIISNVEFDFETPTDDGADNIYSLTITATDSATTAQTATADFTITITDAPFSITATDEEAEENTIFASTAPDFTGDNGFGAVIYTLTGADVDLFTIDPATGIVSSTTVFDFEIPTDDGADNIYSLTITATDSATTAQTASADFTVSITDVDESAPVAPLTIAAATFSTNENNVAGVEVGALTITGDPTTVSLTGTGNEKFYDWDAHLYWYG
ncbi:MAG: cadherin repeat domain-containing protein, partial [Candidatus Thioglobus sp.]